MKKISLLLALCLMLSMFTGCTEPAETTVPTTLPPETTEPTTVPTTMPIPTDPPDPEVIDYDLTLPEGFEPRVAEEDYFLWVSPTPRLDPSTVIVERIERDESILTMSQNEYFNRIDPTKEPEPTEPEETIPAETTQPEQTTEPEETGEPGETTEPVDATQPTESEVERPKDFYTYERWETQVDGWPAIASEYTLVYEYYMAHVLRYEVVVNDCNYVFTFADGTDDNDWLAEFEECVESIDLILDTEGIELDYSGLELYDLKCGLSIWAEKGMEPQEAPGFTACIGNRNVIILVMADDKEANNLTWMKLDDYADLVSDNNQLSRFKWDTYGSLCTSFYSTDANGMEYYNMICVKETETDFWVCQMACAAEDQAQYAKAFSLWASGIMEKN